MNEFDRTYITLLHDVFENGVKKDTRSGDVRSVFGRQVRFDLKKGFPLLSTKKMFTKGILHELLWFLQHSYNSHGSMNIEYLVRNGVHIWDGDAFRWYKYLVSTGIDRDRINTFRLFVADEDDLSSGSHNESLTTYVFDGQYSGDFGFLEDIDMERFLEFTLFRIQVHFIMKNGYTFKYRFGDIGPCYGKQWRSFGDSGIDQIADIVKKLKDSPNDRRIICTAYNVQDMKNMALPPCHVMFQFYTRRLTTEERSKIYGKKAEWDELDEAGIPTLGLSCMWSQRSCDIFLGLPFNIASYAFLTYMIAELSGMVPDELIGSIGDLHLYEEHAEAALEQFTRLGQEDYPKLHISGVHETVDDFNADDFSVTNYHPDGVIKAKLLVGN